MERFDWSSEEVVVKQVDAIAVYTNPAGDIVIRQQDPMGNEDSFVFFPVGSAKNVIEAIKRAAK